MTAFFPAEQRDLDRAHPARALTVSQPSGRVFWVQAGQTEKLAHDAADQRRIAMLHNLLRHESGAHNELVMPLREVQS
jgi:hypothetical protein